MFGIVYCVGAFRQSRGRCVLVDHTIHPSEYSNVKNENSQVLCDALFFITIHMREMKLLREKKISLEEEAGMKQTGNIGLKPYNINLIYLQNSIVQTIVKFF
jgi:hypothetical protein